MEQYNGFFIKQIAVEKKIDTVTGHVGGIIEWHTYLVNPQTAQQMLVRDVTEAKELVDMWFHGDGAVRLDHLKKEIEFTEKHLQDLKKEVELKIASLKKEVEDGENHLNVLKGKLPPRWL